MITKSEGGEEVKIVDKIKTFGAKASFAEAEAFVIPNMEEDQVKELEKIDTITENYCNSCKHHAKVYYDRLKSRTRKEAMQRMKERGVKAKIIGDAINPIPDQDMKKYMKYLVDEKQVGEQRQMEQARQQREKEAMEKRERLITHDPEEGKE
jgi:ribosomal protein L44E